jgi:flagellar biosynthesis protein
MSDKREQPAAIALYYDGHDAPHITAKGEGELARQIIALAEEHGVPLHADDALARLLLKVPLGDEVPENLYVAVAEVLAFTFYLAGLTPEDIRKRREDNRDAAQD